MSARVTAALNALRAGIDRQDVVMTVGLVCLGSGVAVWSASAAAVVIGAILLRLAWPSGETRGGS